MSEEKKETKEKSSHKATITFLIIVVAILALALLSVVFKAEINKVWHKIQGEGTNFTYHDMTFRKTFFGDVMLYETDLAIYRPLENKTIGWTLKFNNDPRILDQKIQANLTDKLTRKVYISFDRAPLQCQDQALAAYKLGEFTEVALGLYVEPTFASQELAQENNNTYKAKNCSDAQGDWSVILLKGSDSNESYVHQEGKCYILETADCKNVETVERFILALIDTMKAIQPPEEQENESNTTNESI